MMYLIMAQRRTARADDDATLHGTMQLPTFALDSDMLGIAHAEHAAHIAMRLLRDAAPGERFTVTASAYDASTYFAI